jgi:diguanylate cyclase
MSGAVDWRQRYTEIADQQEREAKAHAEAEQELTRLIMRLCVAASGLDPTLDPHFDHLRKIARGGDSASLRRQSGDITAALLRASEGRTRPGLARRLLERVDLGRSEAEEALGLWDELAADPAKASGPQLDRLAAFFAARPDGGGSQPSRSGLLARLIGRGQDGIDAEPNQMLLELLGAVDWPGSLLAEVEAFRSELSGDETGAVWIRVVRQISDLVVGAMGRAQADARSTENFLAELNQRLEELDQHMLGEAARREDARASGESLGQQMDEEVVSLSASMRASADLAELQSSVIASLDRMHTQVRTHIDGESARREKAEAEAGQLRKQIHRLEQESFDLRRQVTQTYQEAMRDALTGLPNRRAYDERVAQEHARWRRFGEPLALLVWDVDNFKQVNDTFGHKSGDKALAMIGKTLKEQLRETDFIARYGGEEFVVLLVGAAQEDARRLADAMRLRVESIGLHANGKPVTTTLSGGLCMFAESESAEEAFERADAALYQAKRQGKNCVVAG